MWGEEDKSHGLRGLLRTTSYIIPIIPIVSMFFDITSYNPYEDRGDRRSAIEWIVSVES